jgi:hypothetical protein
MDLDQYGDQVLVPMLSPGDIVIMDNLGGHSVLAFAPQSRQQARRCFTFRPTARTSPNQTIAQISSRLPGTMQPDQNQL